MDSEEIRRLIDEGWAFRIKKSHGKRYITRRKGGKEKSVAPYSDDLWNQIKEYQKPSKATSSMEMREHATTASSLKNPI